ncbi:MAG TPA: DUF4097 family beta strand repeat-containing protein [Spirillospora sp.]|nr:DUF4097 family beta strand repeat-containing protein [Spirillospora sp.]
MTKVQRAGRSGAGRQQRVWTAAGAALLVLAALGVVAAVRSWPAHWRTRTETQHRGFAHAVGRVDLDLSTGDIVVVPGPPGRLDVQRKIKWSGSRPVFTERFAGEVFQAGDRCPHGAECSITYTVTVPASAGVTARTRAGDVTVRNVSGALSLTTTAGDVTGSGLAGPVTARTRAGNVSLGFGRAPAQAGAWTEAGQVTVTVPRGQDYLVQATAAEGGTSVQVPQSPSAAHRIVAHSSAGDVRIAYGS